MFWQPLHECKAEEEHVVFLCVLTEMGQVGPRGRGGRPDSECNQSIPFQSRFPKFLCVLSQTHTKKKKMKMRN